MTTKLTTRERRREIKHMMADKKHKQNDLAAHFDVTRTTIQNDLKAIGIHGATRCHWLVEERRKQVKKMVKAGKTKKEIIIATGSNGVNISQDLRKLGLKTIDQIEREEQQQAAREKALRLLNTTDLSDHEIARAANTSMDVVARLKETHFGGMTRREWEKQQHIAHLWNTAFFGGAARA